MRTSALLVLIVIVTPVLLSTFRVFPAAVSGAFTSQTSESSSLIPPIVSSTTPTGRVIVGFRSNTYANAPRIALFSAVTEVMEDDALNFAIFSPSDPNSFANNVRTDPAVRYVELESYTCLEGTPCGGGGSPQPTSPDFIVTVLPSDATINPGTSMSSSVYVSSIGGYSGSIRLSLTVSPIITNGPTATLNAYTVVVPAGSAATSTLTVSTSANIPQQTYTVKITGTNGTSTRGDYLYVSVRFPNDPGYVDQWGPPNSNLQFAWGKTLGTGNRVIAIVDTGVMYDHPDLQANLWTASGFSEVSDGSHGWNCHTGTNDAYDDFFHGTAVAGVAAAVINNGQGIAGIAQDKIMSVKVDHLDSKGLPLIDEGDAACGIQWAADHGANIISLSFGSQCAPSYYPNCSPTLNSAIDYAWSRGALIVAAAGNDGYRYQCDSASQNFLIYPACNSHAIAVSALQPGDSLTSFSDSGPKIELAAPGQGIYTTFLPSAASSVLHDYNLDNCANLYYCTLGGTSFSAPFVSGLAALAWDYYIQQGATSLTNQQIRAELDSNVIDLGIHGRDESYGYGKPDALALLSPHSTTLTAQKMPDPDGCPRCIQAEPSARAWLYDITSSTYLLNGIAVGSSGQVVLVPAGHTVRFWFDNYYFDGTDNVYLDHINGAGVGAPSSVYPQAGCPSTFFAVSAASETAVYIPSYYGNPYDGLSC